MLSQADVRSHLAWVGRVDGVRVPQEHSCSKARYL